MTGERCARCPEQAERTLGAEPLCNPCAEQILDPIRMRVDEQARQTSGFGGRGRQTGPRRLDYGPDWALLTCDACESEWVGQIGEPCTWCDFKYAEVLTEQRAVLLHPDLPAPDMGSTRRRAEVAWARRLRTGVDAGIITEAEGRSALERELAKSAEFTA